MCNILRLISCLAIGFIQLKGLAQAPAQSQPQASSALRYWPASQRQAQIEIEKELNQQPSAGSLRSFHDTFGSEPHIAGSPGDARNIQRLAVVFRAMAMEVEIQEFWAYLSKPIDAKLDIISPNPMNLSIKEQELAEDRFSKNRDLTIGFNAYSGSGDVTAEVVYANYGTKSDFEKLRALGIEVRGKIVLARYGGNFRGYKAKFAEQAGAVGLIIYTDPDDSGYRKGVPFPEGGWANETCIQRGSLLTLDWPGDPLTPGEFASENATRLDAATLALPKIPVQPIGYGAAREIMSRMKGTPLPADQPDLIKAWQGGLPFPYRLTGGPELRVHLMVKQERSIIKTANITGTLRGVGHPLEKVIIGCHHDAWGYGAGDPLAGLILLYECARSFGNLAKDGILPERTLVFAAWGAEEYGIIGSTEYCESHREDLMQNAVAYINLDAAAMGSNFGSAASPSLKHIIEEVTRDVMQVQSKNTSSEIPNQTVHQSWLGDRKEPDFGNLGGGSDHIGFYCHLGIPSCGLGAGGGPGTAYHSNYDDLYWYRKVVGDDYQPALMLTQVLNLLVARLANAPLLPLDPVRYGADFKVHLESLQKRAKELKQDIDLADLKTQAEQFQQMAQGVVDRLLKAIDSNQIPEDNLAAINASLLRMERQWLVPGIGPTNAPGGLVDRPWFRNLYAASDPDSGYAAWMLPALRLAIERPDTMELAVSRKLYENAFVGLTRQMSKIDAAIQPGEPRESP